MSALAAIYPNSDVRSSGKRGKNSARAAALKLAGQLVLQVGMVNTWPNVQTVRLAIESEAAYSAITVSQAAALIAMAAADEDYGGRPFSCLSSWEQHRLRKANDIDRFWFEDARWRMKAAYHNMLARLQEAAR